MSFEGSPAWIDQVARTRDCTSGGSALTASGSTSSRSHGEELESSGSLDRVVGVMIQRTTRATVRGLTEDLRRAVKNFSIGASRLNNNIVHTGISAVSLQNNEELEIL